MINFQLRVDGCIMINFQLRVDGCIMINFQLRVDGCIMINFQLRVDGCIMINFQLRVDGSLLKSKKCYCVETTHTATEHRKTTSYDRSQLLWFCFGLGYWWSWNSIKNFYKHTQILETCDGTTWTFICCFIDLLAGLLILSGLFFFSYLVLLYEWERLQ